MKTPVSDWGSWQTQLNRGISFSWPPGMPYEFSKQDFGKAMSSAFSLRLHKSPSLKTSKTESKTALFLYVGKKNVVKSQFFKLNLN